MATKLGHFNVIKNTSKPVFSHAKDSYIAGYVCDPTGKEVVYLMFADRELTDTAKVQTNLNLELGYMHQITQSGKTSYIMSCYIGDDKVVIKMPECHIKRALHRVAMNPEDIQPLSFWSRFFL
jgi:hypothetical protein